MDLVQAIVETVLGGVRARGGVENGERGTGVSADLVYTILGADVGPELRPIKKRLS